ncbi:MAG: helix-turn-helix domain-containing protein [Burkholderiaceae bacterium]|nr:helix-turn-helix domain-containing protein [Burkholderiaceae bacterium]
MPEPRRAIDRKDLIEGLGKGLRVIECFDDDHVRVTAAEVAARAVISRTAARRYLLSLVHFGYAGSDGKQFWLLPRVLRLGQAFLDSARLPRLVQPFIQRVSMQSGETVNVSVLDGHEVVYIARSNSPRVISIGYHPGARLPAHVVTPGVVMLSTWPERALDAWVTEHEFGSFTPHTVTDPAEFLHNVHAARALGYWVTEAHLDAGLRGIATPLKDRKGDCVGALGMTTPMMPLTREQTIERFLPLLQDAAQALRPIL